MTIPRAQAQRLGVGVGGDAGCRRSIHRGGISWLYGTLYGMKKTTIYLDDELKTMLEQAARAGNRSEADLIREALRARLAAFARRKPRVPLFSEGLGDPTIAESVEDHLEGFGG